MGILIKNGMVLTDGFVRDSDGKVIPSNNVKIKTQIDNPIIIDETEIIKIVGQAVNNSRVELLKTNDIDNLETNFDQFIKANAQIQHKSGDVVDIQYTGADQLFSNVIESYVFTNDGNYLQVTNAIKTIRAIEFIKSSSIEEVKKMLSRKVSNQLIQNTDFSNIDELRGLITEDEDLISLTFNTGEVLTGRVISFGIPIIISGIYSNGTKTTTTGEFSIDDNLTIATSHSETLIDDTEIAKAEQEVANV